MIVTQRQLDCAQLFLKAGYSLEGAAVWTGDFIEEDGAGLMTRFRFKLGMRTDHGSESLAQWRLERLNGTPLPGGGVAPDGLIPCCEAHHLDPETLEGAVAFAIWECGAKYAEVDKALRAGGNVTQLMLLLVSKYERPNMAVAHIYDVRVPHAEEVLKRLKLIKQHAGATATVATTQKSANAAVGVGAVVAIVQAWHGIPPPVLWAFVALIVVVLFTLSFRSESAKAVAARAERALLVPPAAIVPGMQTSPPLGSAASPPALVLTQREQQILDLFLARLESMMNDKLLFVPSEMDQAFGPVTTGALQ